MAAIHGDRIKHLRKSLGLSQAEMGERLNINQYQISKYERGIDNPSASTLVALAALLGTTTDYLMGLSNIPHPDAEPEPVMTEDERDLLALFRTLPESEQKRLLRALHAFWDDA